MSELQEKLSSASHDLSARKFNQNTGWWWCWDEALGIGNRVPIGTVPRVFSPFIVQIYLESFFHDSSTAAACVLHVLDLKFLQDSSAIDVLQYAMSKPFSPFKPHPAAFQSRHCVSLTSKDAW